MAIVSSAAMRTATTSFSTWSPELATVAALSAMTGVGSQLLSHIRIGTNVGLTAAQLRQFANELSARGETDAGPRVLAALDTHIAEIAKP